MKISRRLALVPCLLVVLSAPMVSADSTPLTDQQIELVRHNCMQVQTNMQRLERIETVARRNRGVGYESTLRLIAAMNSRVAANKLNVPSLIGTAAQIEKKLDEFDKDYIQYNNTFNVTMKLTNCTEQPVTFYDYLTDTRSQRQEVGQDVQAIDQLLDEYQKGLDELKQIITADTGGTQ